MPGILKRKPQSMTTTAQSDRPTFPPLVRAVLQKAASKRPSHASAAAHQPASTGSASYVQIPRHKTLLLAVRTGHVCFRLGHGPAPFCLHHPARFATQDKHTSTHKLYEEGTSFAVWARSQHPVPWNTSNVSLFRSHASAHASCLNRTRVSPSRPVWPEAPSLLRVLTCICVLLRQCMVVCLNAISYASSETPSASMHSSTRSQEYSLACLCAYTCTETCVTLCRLGGPSSNHESLTRVRMLLACLHASVASIEHSSSFGMKSALDCRECSCAWHQGKS